MLGCAWFRDYLTITAVLSGDGLGVLGRVGRKEAWDIYILPLTGRLCIVYFVLESYLHSCGVFNHGAIHGRDAEDTRNKMTGGAAQLIT